MNFLPLWTASVWPTNSGAIVVRRDHVFSTFFWRLRFSSSTRARRVSSMYGPFLSERPMAGSYFLRRVTMSRSEGLAPRRGFLPLVGLAPRGIGGVALPFPPPPPPRGAAGVITLPRPVGGEPSPPPPPPPPRPTLSCSEVPPPPRL